MFAQAREKARAASCLSNQKQTALAFMGYVQDFDETFPRAVFLPDPNLSIWDRYDDNISWDTSVGPYVKLGVSASGTGAVGRGGALWACPSDALERIGFVEGAGRGGRRSYAVPTNYEWLEGGSRMALFARPDEGDKLTVRALADVPAPASTLMLVEHPNVLNASNWFPSAWVMSPAQQQMANAGGGSVNWYDGSGIADAQKPGNQPRHGGGWNYAFADGHVKWHKPEQTVNRAINPNLYDQMWGGASGMWTLDPND